MNNLVKQKLLAIIFIVVVFSAVFIVAIYQYIKRQKVKQEGCYTIGTTMFKVGGSTTNVKYIYSFKKNSFYGFSRYQYILQTKIPNGRYFVAFFPNEPDFSEIYFKVPVPDTIIKAPEDGWTPKEFKEKFGEELWQKIQND